MRKYLPATLLTLLLTVSAFGGDIPLPGGGVCPANTVCCPPDTECPTSSTQSTPAEESETAQGDSDTDSPLTEWLLSLIFGG